MRLHKGDANGRLAGMRAQIYVRGRHGPKSIDIVEGSILYYVLNRTTQAYQARLFVRLVKAAVAIPSR